MRAVAFTQVNARLVCDTSIEKRGWGSGPASSVREKYLPDRGVLDDAHEIGWRILVDNQSWCADSISNADT